MKESLIQRLGGVQDGVVHLTGRQAMVQLGQVSPEGSPVPFPCLPGNQGKILPCLHVREVRLFLEGKLQLSRIQEMEHDLLRPDPG